MSRHRSPAGRPVPLPGPVPGRVPARGTRPPAPQVPLPPIRQRGPRHAAAPALRNGLAGAAATGTALAVVVPAIGALPAAVPIAPADDRPLTIAAAGVAAPALAPAVADGPERVLLASLTPVPTGVAALPAGADAAGLVKSAGLEEAARAAEEARLARQAQADCDADLGGLGRVKPWVRDAARFLSCLYDQPDLIGVAGRARVSDHPRGLAVDLMTRGERGDRIADCALANREALGIAYVIWKQRINYGDGWERMADRGSDNENHRNHVHVSFERGAGSGDPLADLCT